MTATIGLLSHSLAALSFMLLGIWQLDRHRDRAAALLILACATTALWAAVTAHVGGIAVEARLLESARNAAWLGFLYLLLQRGGTRRRALDALYLALLFVLLGNAGVDVADLLIDAGPQVDQAILMASFTLRMLFAVGALVAVHNLYSATAPGARAGIGLPMAALAALWGFDLNLYALSWLQHALSPELVAARGVLVMGLAPVFALAAKRNEGWTIRLSRSVAFRSVALVAALGYLVLVIAIGSAVGAVAGGAARAVQTMLMVSGALVIAVSMVSARTRAWASVVLAKHLFEHRYDYRSEWLRFTDTLGVPGAPGGATAPLDQRVIKAVADIAQSPGGLLLVPDGDGLIARARWQWEGLSAPTEASGAALAAILATGRIVELDPLRRDVAELADEASAIPEWLIAEPGAWAIAPLVHFDRLVGAVLLERPLVDRLLDWEDFDLLRLAGRQVASYLAEARVQEALGEAERFDEFNRRFAFIMHDIKNLVSQLTLVTRNAERHADNPAFRKDMIATLQSSTARMNDLLERLSQHNKARAEEPRPVAVGAIVTAVAAQRRTLHPIVVMGDMRAQALADPARLEQALGHLVQNAIDASPPAEPVTILVRFDRDEVAIDISDRGAGMSPDFIRVSLFKPFSSTKAGGFGIGAYEAREIVMAMGGRITVLSSPGEGSHFTIALRAAHAGSGRLAA